ncbi:MAG: hypothetical protein O3B73_16160 [bacterium]|jgi:hypothetical protein|nr:hypothetical protein [bacterium]
MVKSTPILCRVCRKKMGSVPNFEGQVLTLCTPCEMALKELKKRGILPGSKKALAGPVLPA